MVQPLQARIESNWETLKDKVRDSLDKVVEAVGTYPVAPDDLGLVPVVDLPVPPVKKRRAARKTAAAKRPAAGSATTGRRRTARAKTTAKRARKSA